MKTEIVKWGTKIGQEIAKNSPGILTALGVAGSVTTAVLASKATLQADKKLQEMKKQEEEGHEPFTMKEKAKSILPYYIPAAIMLLTTSACIIGSHSISTRRQMALASAYSLSTEAMKEMENKFKEVNGEKKFEKLKDDIHHDRIVANPPSEDSIIITGKGNTLLYDEFSGRYFRGDIDSVDKAQNKMNNDLLNGHYVTLNDFYYLIGLKDIKLGENLGWHLNSTGPIEIRISYSGADNGEPCGVLEYDVMPTFEYGGV